MSGSGYDSLFDDLLEGIISEADFLKLEAEMIVDEEVRKAYYERLKLHTGLETEMASSDSVVGNASVPVSARRRLDGLLISCLAALCILIGLLVWKMVGERADYLAARQEPVAKGFGVLANESGDAVWSSVSLLEGDLLPGGTMELVSGMVKLELFNGVDLVAHGPARFEVVSDFHLRLVSGRIMCRVPESLEGFRVEIPSGEVFDYGTEFEVEIGDSFESIDVLSGLVEWQGRSGEKERIEAGHGVKVTEANGVEKRAREIASMDELERGFEEVSAKRHQEWERRLKKLNADPRVLALYSMGNVSSDGAHISDLSGAQPDGRIIRTERAMNRWGDPYGGIDFTPTGSRIHVDIEDELESLTLMSWVKIDSLDRLYNSLFLTDGHEQFEPHWQIMNDGRMFFSVKALDEKGKKDKHIAYSPPIWTPEKSGRWMHLATVYDGTAHTVTHYVNGKAVSIDQIKEGLRAEFVKIGAASIGNWSQPRYKNTPEFAVRNLNGTMDELILFSAPLSAGEINELYESGKP
ncbi:MAG: hypothetical protein P1U86_10480 [Verrucomicrobiales bacterium]|nr:hypothetical protein [Verrucomicrobiales bacterium]